MRLTIVLPVVLMLGCAWHRAPAPLPDEFRGLLRSAFEASSFLPCNAPDSAAHGVRFDPGAAPETWPVGAVSRDEASGVHYVRWRARVAPYGLMPLGGQSTVPAYWVFEVLEIRAPRRGECGYQRE
jgi:hypothetical protein